MALLDDVKSVMRITASVFDTEIEDLLNAAEADLVTAGFLQSLMDDFIADTDVTTLSHKLVKRAVTTYVKANFGWNNPDKLDFQQSYDMQKMKLTLIEEFTVEVT